MSYDNECCDHESYNVDLAVASVGVPESSMDWKRSATLEVSEEKVCSGLCASDRKKLECHSESDAHLTKYFLINVEHSECQWVKSGSVCNWKQYQRQ